MESVYALIMYFLVSLGATLLIFYLPIKIIDFISRNKFFFKPQDWIPESLSQGSALQLNVKPLFIFDVENRDEIWR